ncbi:hypothetical protein BAE44_0023965 [Dichanthelium oligosanthes]|uniref:J domain-containing protein n=1 Tax=Dichanthelium oligosanthes TaxID=888268 RepID=A0A1E5UQ67_9POAL|nr:hypothetical protein BAE44_0023965 [Dichanthelium oligosanthes]
MSWGRFYNFDPHQGPSRPWMRRFPAQKPAPSTVVVIDEDDDGDDASDSEVFIIDGTPAAVAGEAAPAAAAAPGCQARKGNGSSGNVINLDDDEDVEEGARCDKAGPSTSRVSGSPASMTPGRGSPGSRYGLDSASDSSDSDLSEGWETATDDGGSSDCEILDDTAGTAREMWETAASRKKMSHDVHECEDPRATEFASCAGPEAQPYKNSEGLFGAGWYQDMTFSSAGWKHGSRNNTGGTKQGPEHAQSSANGAKDGHVPSSVPNAEECSSGNVGTGTEGRTECNENMFQSSSDACKGSVQNTTGGSKDNSGPSSAPNSKECSNGEGVIPEKTSEGFQSPHPDEPFVFNYVSANRVFPGSSSTDWKDGSPPMSVSTPDKIDEKIPEGVYSQKDHSPPEPYNNTYMYSGQQKEVPPFTSRCGCSRQFEVNCPQAQANLCACDAASSKSAFVNVTSGSCSLPQKDLIHDPTEIGQFASVQYNSVIGEREKHKESIEYKRAAEEEWASRQRQLQIQAEEAKKLRKRKKAEAQRLLDMEKRQKQRLQEVRESQRKNEEAIQLKEQYRGVVRKELEDLERRYCDMTSILRTLGIPVEGGEVKAYKQALLKFHPDRVSRNDIYQQVKAEETFKFISRLKEKLSRFS